MEQISNIQVNQLIFLGDKSKTSDEIVTLIRTSNESVENAWNAARNIHLSDHGDKKRLIQHIVFLMSNKQVRQITQDDYEKLMSQDILWNEQKFLQTVDGLQMQKTAQKMQKFSPHHSHNEEEDKKIEYITPTSPIHSQEISTNCEELNRIIKAVNVAIQTKNYHQLCSVLIDMKIVKARNSIKQEIFPTTYPHLKKMNNAMQHFNPKNPSEQAQRQKIANNFKNKLQDDNLSPEDLYEISGFLLYNFERVYEFLGLYDSENKLNREQRRLLIDPKLKKFFNKLFG